MSTARRTRAGDAGGREGIRQRPPDYRQQQQWTQQKDIDAWLIWNIWQVANPQLAQVVPMGEAFRIYRDTAVMLTHKGSSQPQAKAFVEFLQSPAGRKIFAKWGWDTR